MQPLGENTVNTPAFLGKLWKMVNDPTTDHLICWSAAGNSFVIQNQAQFWYELLPLYYKHNNMSSFVRQLNMYGFHKMSTVENGTMDADKDEIQFTHPFFQRDQPELLRNIKRKATTSKASNENSNKHDELTKVLTDVKHLRGRQATVDSQLNAMKQENALLWREVAILRQKHLKQQKIVNKLIQFLVTLVQPSRMTVGVKRGYQLMLNESPSKKNKPNNNKSNNLEGPTIHELDSELDLAPNLVYEDDPPLVDGGILDIKNDSIDSPTASVGSQQTDVSSPIQSHLLNEGNGDASQDANWDKSEFVDLEALNAQPEELILPDQGLNEETLIDTLENGSPTDGDKVFLNPTTQDTLLSNLMKPNYTVSTVNKSLNSQSDASKAIETKLSISPIPPNDNSSNMAVATLDKNVNDLVKGLPSTSDCYPGDLHHHIEATQNELEQFKDILNGYNSFVDANALLGELNKIPQNYKDVDLFNDNSPEYDLGAEDKSEALIDSADPLVSGSELTPYGNNFDFTELFDDSLDGDGSAGTATLVEAAPQSTVNTPQIVREEPVFPAIERKK